MLYITYFVHGTTLDNEGGIASGWKGCELSEHGKRQARNRAGSILGRWLGDNDWASARIGHKSRGKPRRGVCGIADGCGWYGAVIRPA